MARATVVTERLAAYEPLYDIDPQTGASIEVFYADRVLAESFGTHAGWFWWTCRPGCLPDRPPIGPFATSYRAYRDALARRSKPPQFGRRITPCSTNAECAGAACLGELAHTDEAAENKKNVCRFHIASKDIPHGSRIAKTHEKIIQNKYLLARPEGFEPPTPRFVVWCAPSIRATGARARGG
jgi:hypothetical protein